MRSLAALALGWLAMVGVAAAAECRPSVEVGGKKVYVAEWVGLTWCWPEVSGGVGHVFYVVESRTNNGAWVEEGETDLSEVTLSRSVGDAVAIRYYACDDVACSDYSPNSQTIVVYPDFDADGSGKITIGDFNLLRDTTTQTRFGWFRKVFGAALVDGVYLR